MKIRKYNSGHSCTSVGATIDKNLADGRQGVYTLRVQGAVVHEMGALRPAEGNPPKFAQIYIQDEKFF